jgi:hypothetical protein
LPPDALDSKEDFDIAMNAGEIDGTSEMSFEHNVVDYGSRHIIRLQDDSRWSFNGGGGDGTRGTAIKMPTPFNRER